jgi:cytochrome c oxidase subunit 2
MFDIRFWMPESANALAQGTDSLFMFILWVSVISLVIVCGSMVFLAIRYRASSDVSRDKPPKDHLGLEVTWTLIPTVILMLIFYWGTRDYVQMSIPQSEAMEVRVLGQKWFWTFDYPKQGIRLQATEEMNAKNAREGRPVGLVVPVDTPVRIVGSSADVLHSVYVPAFRMKKDVIPNRYTVTGFRATKEGVYDLFCTEYCGTKHSGMITKVTVLSQAEFSSFVEDAQSAAESPIDGATLFAGSGCAGCHSVTADAPPGGIGPALYGVFGRQERLTTGDTVLVDENYLRESIENPIAKVVEGYGPIMPSYAGRLSEEELTALIVYLKGLK